jgi:hypothetical protein
MPGFREWYITLNGDAQPVRRELYASVDAMLSPRTLSSLLGRPVLAARLVARSSDISAYSGSALQAVEVSGGGCHTTLLLKRISPAWDYFMRVTEDHRGREVLAWQTGLLDALPSEVTHAYLACAYDRAAGHWAILMRDVSDHLLSTQSLDEESHDFILRALAAFHAAAWDDPRVASPEAGFNHPWHQYHVISPAAAAGDTDPNGVMPRIVRDGWDRLRAAIDPHLAATLLALANDPQPLVDALAAFPQTVVHADVRPPNLGLERGDTPRLIVLDWALVGRGVPGLDLIWYLAGLGERNPIPRDQSIARYRDQLASRLGARFDAAWWKPMLDLSLLGGLIRHGWIAARALDAASDTRRAQARADLDWLVPGALAGLARLSGRR